MTQILASLVSSLETLAASTEKSVKGTVANAATVVALPKAAEVLAVLGVQKAEGRLIPAFRTMERAEAGQEVTVEHVHATCLNLVRGLKARQAEVDAAAKRAAAIEVEAKAKTETVVKIEALGQQVENADRIPHTELQRLLSRLERRAAENAEVDRKAAIGRLGAEFAAQNMRAKKLGHPVKDFPLNATSSREQFEAAAKVLITFRADLDRKQKSYRPARPRVAPVSLDRAWDEKKLQLAHLVAERKGQTAQ